MYVELLNIRQSLIFGTPFVFVIVTDLSVPLDHPFAIRSGRQFEHFPLEDCPLSVFSEITEQQPGPNAVSVLVREVSVNSNFNFTLANS